MLSDHKNVKMVLKQNPNDATVRCKKMIVVRHYCYREKGIYSGTCSI